MAPSSLASRPEWYKAGDADPTLDPAREAFKIAAAKFGAVLSRDARKQDRVNQTSSILELQRLVADAQSKYTANHGNGRVRKWLVKLSTRITHYGAILDVLAQHHPEYVALAWGAMKFLFLTVVSHEALVSCVAKGLARIADTLASVEVIVVLYPTEQMKLALAETYAHMIRFFLRAQDWLTESSWMRALHSVTRPKELRYDDILQDITAATTHFRSLAVAASQAEQRDIHVLLLEMKQMMITHQKINASAMHNTNTALTDLQFSSILSSLINLPLDDPDKTLQQATFLRNRATLHHKTACDPFWLHPRFQAWSESPSSNLIMVQGTFAGRSAMRASLVDAIAAIRQANATALWALKTSNSAAAALNSEASISSVELLKYLTAQALRFTGPPSTTTTTERTLALSCARFQTARDEREWIGLLAGSLAGLGSRQVFIVVDVELLGREAVACVTQDSGNRGNSSNSNRFMLPESLRELFAQLEARASGVVVKVLLASYGSPLFGAAGEACRKDVVLAGRPRPQRLGGAGRAARGALGVGRGQLRRGFGLRRGGEGLRRGSLVV